MSGWREYVKTARREQRGRRFRTNQEVAQDARWAPDEAIRPALDLALLLVKDLGRPKGQPRDGCRTRGSWASWRTAVTTTTPREGRTKIAPDWMRPRSFSVKRRETRGMMPRRAASSRRRASCVVLGGRGRLSFQVGRKGGDACRSVAAARGENGARRRRPGSAGRTRRCPGRAARRALPSNDARRAAVASTLLLLLAEMWAGVGVGWGGRRASWNQLELAAHAGGEAEGRGSRRGARAGGREGG